MLGFLHVSLVIKGVKKWMNKNQISVVIDENPSDGELSKSADLQEA